MDKESNRKLHPIWFFVILILITIVLSTILSIFNFQGTQTDISLGSSSTSVLTVESLLSKDGIKFMISECVNNGANLRKLFTPVSYTHLTLPTKA